VVGSGQSRQRWVWGRAGSGGFGEGQMIMQATACFNTHRYESNCGWADIEPRTEHTIRLLLTGRVYITMMKEMLVTSFTVKYRP